MNKEEENLNTTGQVRHEVLQTYADDMAKVIEEDRQGLVKKIIHDEEEREFAKKHPVSESRKNAFFLLFGAVFIFAGLATLSYFIFTEEIPEAPLPSQPSSLIFSDSTTSVEISGLSKEKITEAIYNAAVQNAEETSGVERIYLTNNSQEVGLREFMSLIKSTFSPSSSSLLVSDKFLIGTVNEGVKSADTESSENNFFILVKMRSIVDIFDSLRAWEGKMLPELSGFFGFPVNSDRNYLLSKGFENGLVENKNSRVLYDKDGNIVLMYVFANENSVVITDSEGVAREIMIRLASSEVKK